jgi:uncharacterized protein with beta-barrel porin domain
MVLQGAREKRWLGVTASLLAGTALAPPAWPADFLVTNNADSGAGSLRQAIINSNAAGGSNNIIINSGVGTITLTSGDLPTVANNASIVGNNNTLSGGGTFRGLFIGGFSGASQTAVSVSVSNLTIANATAQGGNGRSGGGGGAGLGGAIFVASQSTLTVSNVTLTANSAVGGAGGAGLGGGGGGMGGNGGASSGGGPGNGNGGGGGLGSGANGGNGTGAQPGTSGIATNGASGGTGSLGGGAGGANGGGGGGGGLGSSPGGGGGVGGANGVPGVGAAGGFGGGGSGTNGGAGGAGGFGGGGGSTSQGGNAGGAGGFGGGGGRGTAANSSGGFGGGNATFSGAPGGGGGAGLGGGVFVQQGGTLNIAGAFNVTGGTVTAGAGGGTGTAGSAFGAGIFLQGNGTVDFSPGAGVTQTMSNGIADQTGSGGTGANAGSWTLAKSGAGTLVLQAANTYSGGTNVTGGLINFSAADNFGSGLTTLNGGGLQWATGNTTDISSKLAPLGSGGGTFDTNGNDVTFASAITGSGGLIKAGLGTLILSGANSYSGGTIVTGGVLQGTTSSLQGNIANNAMVVFSQSGSGTYAGNMSGSGSLALQGGGTYALTGNSTFTGPTTVTGSKIVVNGSMTSPVTLDAASTIGGSGSIGGLTSNGATLTPGNSIGTLTVNGNFTQNGGTYVVEANAQGQSDRINVAGTATINGATVQAVAAPGNYGTSTTYTILNATGGVSGTYSGVSSNFAFLTPSLTYNANNVFLTLALQGNAFSGFGGNTLNQRAVGYALDQSYATATGDFASVVGALANLNTQQGPYALNQISGQPYADFGTANLASNTLFMNALGQQMALARGGAGVGQRQALAQACEVEFCDATSPFSVWASGLGGFGSVQGDGNSQTFTYNLGGAAAGIDYRVMPSLLLGIGAGYTSGTQWTDTFQGKGWTNAVSVAAYGSFTMAGFYADLLAGYAYSNNQLQRQIFVPGLQPRTANGSTGANQFLGQAEIGYQVPVYAPAQASVTPFARLQVMSVNQAAFSEWGANSLSLNVQQQTTNSLRSTLGAQLNGAIGLGDTRTLDMALRLGWLHEYAYTGRPVTAAFAGAPAAAFTVYGATPQRDAAAIGFQASTNVATATQIFFRYDGDIGSGTDNHALNVGLRLSW